MSKSFAATAVLMGTVIGAGILGIPYVVSKSGFSIGLFHIIAIGILMMIIMLYLGEIVLRTKSEHQLPGYAGKYLGRNGRRVMLAALTFGLYSALLAYIIGEGRSLSYLLFNTPIYQFQLGLVFWLILSLLTYSGIKALEKGEIVGVTLVFVTIISISVYFANKINPANLYYVFPSNFFIPFGVILFAFLGFSAIPEINIILGKEKKSLKKIIITAYTLVALIYIAFTIVVIGTIGDKAPEVATIALGKPFIALGMITMFTAYLALSFAMMDTFRLDLRKKRFISWLYTILVPLAAFIILNLAKKANFVNVLGIGGVISGGLTAILILLMVKQAKKFGDQNPAYKIPYSDWILYAIAALFIIGALTEIAGLIR